MRPNPDPWSLLLALALIGAATAAADGFPWDRVPGIDVGTPTADQTTRVETLARATANVHGCRGTVADCSADPVDPTAPAGGIPRSPRRGRRHGRADRGRRRQPSAFGASGPRAESPLRAHCRGPRTRRSPWSSSATTSARTAATPRRSSSASSMRGRTSCASASSSSPCAATSGRSSPGSPPWPPPPRTSSGRCTARSSPPPTCRTRASKPSPGRSPWTSSASVRPWPTSRWWRRSRPTSSRGRSWEWTGRPPSSSTASATTGP